MPTQSLNQIDNFNTIANWLNLNLTTLNSITPVPSQILNVPTNKGIYFWFMKSNAYEKLSNFIEINRLQEVYEYDIKGIKYDLVYIGTAGTGKNGKSNLQERIKWHISQTHLPSNICHGTLSTLRTGISSIVSDDLELPNTEQLVNNIFEKYFKLYFIKYDGEFESCIDDDERILIKIIKPLFNLKNNPNAKSSSIKNLTKDYKFRRNHIIKNTKARLGCKNKESKEIMRTKKVQTENTIFYDQIDEEDENGCIDYYVFSNQNIAEVTRGIEGLYEGAVRINIWNSNDVNQIFDLIKFRTPTTGSGKGLNSQNIYTYFSNTAGENHNNISRGLLISKWMLLNKIKEITVRVCPVLVKKGKFIKTKNITKSINNSIEVEEQKITILKKIESKISILNNKSIPKLLILKCTDSKTESGLINNTPHYDFGINLNNLRNNRIEYYNRLIIQSPEYFKDKLARCNIGLLNHLTLPAIDRYANNKSSTFTKNKVAALRNCIKNNNLHLLILSGLYGVLKYDDQIIDYHLEMNKGDNWYGNFIHDSVKKYIQANKISNDCVFYSIGSNLSSYHNSLKPNQFWTDLWIEHGRGHAASSFWNDHFLKLL
jgi:hypothetical protein